MKERSERDSNPDLCDAGAVPYQFINIEIVSIRSSNEISLIKTHVSSIYGLIRDPHNDQLPVGVTAQLVEHCTGIAEVRARVLFRPEFFRPCFRYCSSSIT